MKNTVINFCVKPGIVRIAIVGSALSVSAINAQAGTQCVTKAAATSHSAWGWGCACFCGFCGMIFNCFCSGSSSSTSSGGGGPISLGGN